MNVLVTMRVVENVTYPERRDAISHDWGRFFARHGVTPILVPNSLDDIEGYFGLGASGVLLTGGDDLGPDENWTLRDKTEHSLIEGALKRRLPMFGACRGLHMINRYFGGRLSRALPEPHVGEHDVRFDGRGMLRINSFHNQGVMSDGLARDLAPLAVTAGGVVEALRHRNLPVTAVQWHPERPNPAAALDDEMMREWFAQCA